MIALLLACTPSDGDGGDTNPSVDTADVAPPPPVEPWTLTPLDDADGGLQLRLVSDPTGGAWAAWFANTPTADGICDEIDVAPPPRERFALHVARIASDGTATVEQVADPVAAVQPTGLDLAVDPQGRPALAYTGGVPEGQYCGAHDAVLARFDGRAWISTTAARDSGDSSSGDSASDAGFVVGQWPAVAFDADQRPAVLHRDTHFGSLQRDDHFRADAELAREGPGGWSHEVVDLGQGGGDQGRLAFDAEGRPVAVYGIPVESAESRLGVWLARRSGDAWERVRLHDGEYEGQIALSVGDHGIAVAFTDVSTRSARLRELPPEGDLTDETAWTNERVGRGPYDEGRHVSLAHAPGGDVVLAYHVCQRLTDPGTSCNINDEGLVVATRSDGSWTHEVVRAAEGASCGRYTGIAFGPDGRVWVGFRCSVSDGADFALRPFLAWRDW